LIRESDDIPADLPALEVDFFFSLSPADIAAVHSRRRMLNRLGNALKLCFIRMSDRLLNSIERVSPVILSYPAEQIDIAAPDLGSLRSMYR